MHSAIEVDELTTTERGAKGFGSTGVSQPAPVNETTLENDEDKLKSVSEKTVDEKENERAEKKNRTD